MLVAFVFAISLHVVFTRIIFLYVTQTTALQPVFPEELPTLTIGANLKVPPSSANDVGTLLHPASVPDVPSPGFFGLRGCGL